MIRPMSLASLNGPFWWMVGASLLTGVGAIGLSGLVLAIPAKRREQLLPHLLSFSVGTLLVAAFQGLIPHALDRVPPGRLFPVFLAGLVVFMVFERLMLWRHCHEGACEAHSTSAALILVGDSMHNLVDGILIAATFLTSIPLGIATSLAVLSHEVPQELGDFAILLHGGYSPRRALMLNSLASATTPLGALLAWFCLPYLNVAVPYVMALAAAGFVYVAMADLVPSLHRCTRLRQHLLQLTLIVAGMLLVGLVQSSNHAH